MIKKIIASTTVAGLMAVSSVGASAAPVAFDSGNRVASKVNGSENFAGGSEIAIVAIVAAIIAGIIVAIEKSENNDLDNLPTSP